MNGIDLILTEHALLPCPDDVSDGQLAMAAACYAAPEQLYRLDGDDDDCVMNDPWPWEQHHDLRHHLGERKMFAGSLPADPATCSTAERIALLAKAGAMIAKELDRLLLETQAAPQPKRRSNPRRRLD